MGQFNVSSLLGRSSHPSNSPAKAPWARKTEKTVDVLAARESNALNTENTQNTILFVCTGNIARSASAELISRHMAPNSGWNFASAGTGAVIGAPVAEHIDRLLIEQDVQIGGHKARQISREILEESALVLVMERHHMDWIMREWPEYRPKVHLLKQMARLRESAGRRSDPISYMKLTQDRPTRKDDIADPFRRGPEAAQKAVTEIQHSLDVIVPWLGQFNAG